MPTEIDATPASSPGTDVTGVSSNSPDVTSDSSTEGADFKPDLMAKLNEIEADHNGEEPEAPPATTTEEATEEAEPKTDEPGEDEAGAGEKVDLSQAGQEKQFTERPEWQKALKLVAPEKAKEMRGILRSFYEREAATTKQLEVFKPSHERVERLRKAVGDEGVENSIALVELWQRGDERAEAMLTELLTDLQTRRGAKLSSPDLLKKAEALKQKVEQGLMDEAEAEEENKLLSELERTRAGLKQTEAEKQASHKATQQAAYEKMMTEHTTALNDWEAQIVKSDPDYLFRKDDGTPTIQDNVKNQAFAEINNLMATKQGPVTIAEKLAIVKKAYQQQKAFASQRTRTTRIPVTTNGSSRNVRPKPTNLMETLDALEEQHNAD
jgi:hypothetical protein